MRTTRRSFLAAAAAGIPARPNVLFIVTDGWPGYLLPVAGDLNLVAPNLSRLAREGIHCSRAYTSYAVCCRSRAAMLTGKYPHAAGVRRNHSLLPLGQPTFSAALQAGGYRTGYIGKWHLDGRESPGFAPPERRRGFDYWAAYNVSLGAHQNLTTCAPIELPTPGTAPWPVSRRWARHYHPRPRWAGGSLSVSIPG